MIYLFIRKLTSKLIDFLVKSLNSLTETHQIKFNLIPGCAFLSFLILFVLIQSE